MTGKSQKNIGEKEKFLIGSKKSIFQDEEDTDYWDPPLLYKKPGDEAFKWMISRYLEIKKLL